eukprot:9375231-Pyramimonas_sp.AAC.1
MIESGYQWLRVGESECESLVRSGCAYDWPILGASEYEQEWTGMVLSVSECGYEQPSVNAPWTSR